MKKFSKIYKILLMLFPVVLYFSYFPVISLGSDSTMYYELSLPLIYLVVFDIVATVLMWVRGKLGLYVKKWPYLLFPIFASLSILWSSNVVRGVLTAGVLWAVFIAVFAVIALRDEVAGTSIRRKMIKVFLGASLLVCAWCLLQCVLDLLGVPREASLLCEGCVSTKFGFPHPNGFAIEPQFLGNLLLAPAILTMYLSFKNKKYLLPFFAFVAMLFLTFSRGAIYAFGVAMVFLTAFKVVQARKTGGEKLWKKLGILWITIVLSFGFTLNLQGVMAEFGPTSDTYGSAVAKVLNHLSLGIIDFREKKSEPVDTSPVVVASAESLDVVDGEIVSKDEAEFDGYVEESTEARTRMTNNALTLWGSSFKNVMVGVGLGGAGKAMQEAGLIDNANEIVQNQYVASLLETGLIGVGLIILLLVLVLKYLIKVPINSLLLTLLVAYGVSLCFFSGLPNALHIYLMPAWILVLFL
ncbi:O-antigen ligase family protein [Candidatus Saccharibacteria bacterium]|nr:O-antigen ligase family protein [Candidatus Saccharibacteria bacterium]